MMICTAQPPFDLSLKQRAGSLGTQRQRVNALVGRAALTLRHHVDSEVDEPFCATAAS